MSTIYRDPVSNTADILDSRDIIARIEELESDADALTEDERDALATLNHLAEQGADYLPDWEHGEALIHDDYFEDYARQLAEDIGAIDPDAGWPLSYIDWVRAADALKMDYAGLDFDGALYWGRA